MVVESSQALMNRCLFVTCRFADTCGSLVGSGSTAARALDSE